AGGVVGSLMFGGPWRGGLSVLDVIVLSGLIYLMFRGLTSDEQHAPGVVSGTNGAGTAASNGTWSLSRMAFALAPPGTPLRSASRIREIEPEFDPRRFGEMVVKVFARLQSAWTARDPSSVVEVLTPGMKAFFERDCQSMRATGRINRFERIEILRARITEAWRERGHDHVTVHLGGTAIDYTTDERGAV